MDYISNEEYRKLSMELHMKIFALKKDPEKQKEVKRQLEILEKLRRKSMVKEIQEEKNRKMGIR